MPLQRAKLRTVSFSSSRFQLLLSFCYIYCCYCCGLCRHNVTKYFVPYQKADALWTCTHTNDIHTVTKIAPPNGHQHSTAAPRIYFYVRPDEGTGRDVKDRTRREKDSNNKQDLAATAWPQLAFLCFCFLFFFLPRLFSLCKKRHVADAYSHWRHNWVRVYAHSYVRQWATFHRRRMEDQKTKWL